MTSSLCTALIASADADHFEYETDSPKQFDLMVGMTQCEGLLNATTWTGSALRRTRSQLGFTLSKQSLTKRGPTQSWQQLTGGMLTSSRIKVGTEDNARRIRGNIKKTSHTIRRRLDACDMLQGEDDLLEGSSTEADHPIRLASGSGAVPYHRSELAAVEEHYLRVPAMGEGSVSGRTTWKSMSTAARISLLRFSSNSQFIANASPVAYGVMHEALRPQDDSELEAFACIECLQPPDKVPYLGG
ncbi:hypothetical protein Emag_000127 [Eimeria magna]